MPATAVIYCRISRDSAGEHLGVDRQEKLCRALAKRHKLAVVDVLVDNDLSAYRAKRRPAFERLLDMMKNGETDAVVAYHADRLYRRVADLERIVNIVEASGTAIHTVTAGDIDLTTATGRMTARIVGAVAQKESEQTGKRVRDKHDELAAHGKHPGGRTPFGYGPGYVVNEAEAEVIRRMAQRVLQGASLLRIARELDADRIPTREGRSWHHSSVRASLVNPAIAGMRVHRREVAGPAEWPAVLDRATWEQVRAVLADPARKRTRPARKYLLAGLLVNENGDPLNGLPRPGGRNAYSTRQPANPSMSVGADDIDAEVVEMILTALDEADLPTAEASDVDGEDVAGIEADLAELAELRGTNTISLAEWMAARKPLLERLDAAHAAARSARRPPTTTVGLLAQRGAVRRAWPALTFDEQREILRATVERVVIAPAARGKWTPIEERIARIDWRA